MTITAGNYLEKNNNLKYRYENSAANEFYSCILFSSQDISMAIITFNFFYRNSYLIFVKDQF